MIGSTIRSAPFALALALLLCGCQTDDYSTAGSGFTPPSATLATAGTPMDGMWTSADGVFYATFQGGSFTSRFSKTNEVLAQGTYTVSGNAVNMEWISVATKQRRTATCNATAPDTVSCKQQDGGAFDLRRAAAG